MSEVCRNLFRSYDILKGVYGDMEEMKKSCKEAKRKSDLTLTEGKKDISK